MSADPTQATTVTITVKTTTSSMVVTAPYEDHRVTLLEATGALRVIAGSERTLMFAPGQWLSVDTEVNR